MLAIVAALFFVTLILKLEFPGSVFAGMAFFCSEAALVGGIADWFAVTALFEKPLGFPWHTALVPRKRDKFTAACVKMVQEEFFSKKKLLMRVRKLNLLDLSIAWIEKNRGKALLAGFILTQLEDFLDRADARPVIAQIERELQYGVRNIPQEKIFRRLGQWIARTRQDEAVFAFALCEIRAKFAGESGRERIRGYLEAYSRAQSRSFLGAFITMAAQLSNIINLEEAADVLQQQLLRFIDALMEPEHPLRLRLLLKIKETAAELVEDESWQDIIRQWQVGISENVAFESRIESFIDDLRATLKRSAAIPGGSASLVVQSPLAKLVLLEIDRSMEKLKTDAKIRQALNGYLYDLVGRSVLQAQAMVGVIVREVLRGLSDQELNQLIYAKIEPDLLWIRMNGSIVGAIVGLGMFVLLYLIG